MKRTLHNIPLLVGSFVLLVISACMENSPVQLLYVDDISAPTEVSFLRQLDTTIVSETLVDLTGLTQQDERDYPGTVLVTGVRMDLGGGRNSLAYARILLEDRNDPKDASGGFGKLVTYPRLAVGNAKLDKSEFDVAAWVIQIRSLFTLHQVSAGIFYKLLNEGNLNDKQFVYKPGHTYLVEAEGREKILPFEINVPVPDDLTMVDPKPLALVFKDEDFVLRWKGNIGEIARIVISTYDEKAGRAGKPLMLLKANPRSQSLLLSSKILKLVPSSPNGRYMLSLISANRKEISINGYSGKVLVQGASIHNVVVSFR